MTATGNVDVEVLLCTYNGEKYLGEFLESLALQTHKDFQLVVSDDCSRDGTVAVIEKVASRFGNPPIIVRQKTPSGSAAANFSNILSSRRPAYAFLADQDDRWKPHKIARSLEFMKELEARYGTDTPILIHGDLQIIDGSGQFRHPSFWAYKKIDPIYGQQVQTALMHPSVVGCTALVNRSLLERLGKIPSDAVMHDWWINLVAATFGKVEFIREPLVEYRIHGANVSKPRQVNLSYVASSFIRVFEQGRRWISVRLRQGKAFNAAFGSEAPASLQEVIRRFASLDTANPIARRWRLVSGGYSNPGLARKLAALLFV